MASKAKIAANQRRKGIVARYAARRAVEPPRVV